MPVDFIVFIQNKNLLLLQKKFITICDQEYIPQGNMNLSANLFIDNNGLVKSTFVYTSRRWFPLNSGTGTFNELVDCPDVEGLQKTCVTYEPSWLYWH